ncbi:MAG: OmpH family outer membrane protein [Proteobacteria bacterium]|nr:OmpH family outer membrane protein [Pseudomonadota bacterium]
MKKVAVLLVAAMVMSLSLAAKARAATDASSGSIKIGYVDMNRALNEVNEGKKAKSQLEADGRAKKQKLEIMQNEIKSMKEELDKQRLILSKEALQEKEAKFQQKFFELQKMSVDFEREFAEKEVNFIRPISEKLAKVIQQIGQQDSYTVIMPSAMALYSIPGSDLTDKVIAQYNKGK